jgi:O-antigen/teichoic acid export membrane protein
MVRAPLTVVSAGTAGGQVAIALSLPFVTALYSAADVGRFALALAYAQLGAILVTGRLEQILPRLDEGQRWAGTKAASLPAGLCLGLLVVTGLSWGRSITDVALALALLASVAAQNVSGMAVLAQRQFGLLARMRLTNGVVTAVGQVVGGLVAPGHASLVIAYVAGNLVAVGFSARTLLGMRSARGPSGVRSLVRTERLGRFAITVGGSAAMSSAALALPVLALDRMFGTAVVGSFFIARKLLMVPTQLVASTASEVTYAMVATQPPDAVRAVVRRWLRGLRMAAVATLGLGVGLAAVIELVIPADFIALWEVTLLLTGAAAAQLVATSLSNVLLAIRRERIRLAWNAGRLIGLVGLFLSLDALDASYVETVAGLSAYLIVTYGLLLLLTLRALQQKVDVT